MKSKSFKNFIAVAATVLASVGAQAAVIDFESTGSPRNYNALDYAVDGFVFNQTMDNVDISAGAPWAGNGPAHSGSFAALNNYGGIGEITKAGGGTFSFESLWLKSWYNQQISGTITGLFQGTEVGSVSGVFNGWTLFSGNFTGIDTLRISTDSIFLVDDISLDSVVSPVPEPETYALLLAGLGLMGVAARRRKQQEMAA